MAAALAAMGCDIVTGGGPGLMQAANEGAAWPARRGSVGIRVELPFEQDVNPFVEQAFEHQTFFTRLHHFVIASDAFVVVPGGIGTVLETLMIWQLLQVRHVDDVPLILVGKMWRGLVDWAKTSMLDPRLALASPEDLQIPLCLDTADEAIAVGPRPAREVASATVVANGQCLANEPLLRELVALSLLPESFPPRGLGRSVRSPIFCRMSAMFQPVSRASCSASRARRSTTACR